MTVNKRNVLVCDLCAYANVYIFIDTKYFLNRSFLICYLILTIPEIHFFQIEIIFNIGSSIYIYIISFRLYILFLIFIPKAFLVTYHDKIPITSFWVCSKNERFDHSSNISFSLIPYLPIIIITMWDLNYLL